jgi:peptidoglycan-associated lipoprotein
MESFIERSRRYEEEFPGFWFEFILVTGCAKKVVKEGTEEKTATVQKEAGAAPVAAGETEEQRLAREKAMKEAALKEQQEKERLAAQKAAATAAATEFADVRFDFDKYDLKPEARETLKKLGDYLTVNKGATVLIEGNCDERGTVEYNLALGEKRAVSAMKYLVSLGVSKDRVKTISYGKERPLDPGHNEEAWAKNRRDHFVVTAK